MTDHRTPIERMIDKATGYDPISAHIEQSPFAGLVAGLEKFAKALEPDMLTKAILSEHVDVSDDAGINVELFPCAGGMAKGFKDEGITFDIAIEIAQNHCDSYQLNIGHRPVCMDARDFLRMLHLGFRRRVKLLVADPPCTPWSRSGKRLGISDPRDMLQQTCQIIRALRPEVYLIGNVPGLDDGPNLTLVQHLIGGLSDIGYCTADFSRLDAANYGVPQHRIRPFWFGHLAGPCIRWPEPTHGDPSALRDQLTLPGVRELTPWITCGQALAHLSGEDLGRPVKLKWKDGIKGPNHRPSSVDSPGATITRNTHNDGCLLVNDKHAPPSANQPANTIRGGGNGHSAPSVVMQYDAHHPPSFADEPGMTVRASGERGARSTMVLEHEQPAPKRGRLRDVGRVGQGNRRGKPTKPSATITSKPSRVGAGQHAVIDWPWDRPATTVQSDDRLGPPGHHDELFAVRSLPNAVVISEKAATILQGFPSTWVFIGKTKKERWSQIGQAMPPPLARAVAGSVGRQIDATARGIPAEAAVVPIEEARARRTKPPTKQKKRVTRVARKKGRSR